MTQLKTLKDMEKEHEKYTDEDRLVVADEVKQEAIKWIKELESRLKPEIEYERWKKERIIGSSEPKYSAEHRKELDELSFKADNEWIWIEIRKREGIIEFVKHFFNITDEDLK